MNYSLLYFFSQTKHCILFANYSLYFSSEIKFTAFSLQTSHYITFQRQNSLHSVETELVAFPLQTAYCILFANNSCLFTAVSWQTADYISLCRHYSLLRPKCTQKWSEGRRKLSGGVLCLLFLQQGLRSLWQQRSVLLGSGPLVWQFTVMFA